MTTIAYKDGVIAADSRILQDTVIVTDTYNKIIKRDNLVFAFAGTVADFQVFLAAISKMERAHLSIITG